MDRQQKYAIIVAGGKGLRMNSDIPKQFMKLGNLPVLMHSINAFYTFDSSISIIVVLPENHFTYWKDLCIKYEFTTPHTLIKGGSERFYSVQNGLRSISDTGIVAIHDGVRPMLTNKILSEGFDMAQAKGSAIPVIQSIDSLRFIDSNNNYPIERKAIVRVQTPQFFDITTLQASYTQDFDSFFTDDASVWEKAGNTISCFEGSNENLKITTAIDLAIAEVLLTLKV